MSGAYPEIFPYLFILCEKHEINYNQWLWHLFYMFVLVNIGSGKLQIFDF